MIFLPNCATPSRKSKDDVEAKQDKDEEQEENAEEEGYAVEEGTPKEKFHKIMVSEEIDSQLNDSKQSRLLPEMFELNNPYPGEPRFMRLRRHPAVLRIHKYKQDKDPEAYWLSEAMLYLPYEDEDDLQAQISDARKSEESWASFVKKIKDVKGQTMEFLDGNEEARAMAAEMIIEENLAGVLMDPEGEQEKEDNMLDELIQHEDFSHLDPTEYIEPPEKVFDKAFRPIEVRPIDELHRASRRMDYNQRKVLEIGVRHARGLVKARGGANSPPSAPLLMVDGAAGAGKSSTINILKETIQHIMERPGDNPECPHILLCAPTGRDQYFDILIVLHF